jgi:hypothetical protein
VGRGREQRPGVAGALARGHAAPAVLLASPGRDRRGKSLFTDRLTRFSVRSRAVTMDLPATTMAVGHIPRETGPQPVTTRRVDRFTVGTLSALVAVGYSVYCLPRYRARTVVRAGLSQAAGR